MKRAANQSGAVMSSQTARQYMSENAEEDEVSSTQSPPVEQSVEVEMRAVSNGSTISSMSAMPAAAPSIAPKPAAPDNTQSDNTKEVMKEIAKEIAKELFKEEPKLAEAALASSPFAPVSASAKKEEPKKEEPKEILPKDNSMSISGTINPSSNNPLQQLQIVRLLTDLGDRLRQSEKEREILWKEIEICRKQISDMNGNANKSEQSYSSLESQIEQREVFVKELLEKQIGLEQKLKDQISAFDASKEEQMKLQEEQGKLQDKLQDKLNSVETAAGSAIVRVEDVIAENSKLSKRVEQLGQDKERLSRKLVLVEETLTQTQDMLKAKALVFLTDQSIAAKTSLPQEPAWTGDDTLKVSQAASDAVSGKKADAAAQSPVSNITASLRPQVSQPSLFMITIVTAMIAGIAAFGAIWLIKNMGTEGKLLPTQTESELSGKPDQTATTTTTEATPLSQKDLMSQAAILANQIEPGSLGADQDETLQDDTVTPSSDEASAKTEFDAAIAAQNKAVEDFKSDAPTSPVTERIKADKNLPKQISVIEEQAFNGVVTAQHDLAAIYTAGHGGVKIDYAKAAKWFEEAAHNGSANAQYNLGVLYHQGLGLKKDTSKAIELYRVAASNNHPEALYNLAIAYVEGVGVEYNPQIASTYFERAADGGIVEAAYNLGLLHENGLLGESQPDEAVFWYKIASDKGNKDASAALADLKKKLSMTDDDVSRLTQKIATTMPGYLTDDGKASLPELARPSAENAPASASQTKSPASSVAATPTAPVAPAKTVANKNADPVIVSQIQEQLMRLGFYKGIPNGILSNSLMNAIKSYQTKNGLKADGQPSDDLLVQMLASNNDVRAKTASTESAGPVTPPTDKN